MIKEKELREGRQIRFRNGDNISFETVQEGLADLADQNAIKIAFYKDQVKFGNLFSSSIEDCIVLHHPEHRNDYICTVMRVTYQGKYAFLNLNDYGQSKMAVKVYAATEGRKEAKEERRGLPMSERIGAAIGAGIVNGVMSIGANKKKFEEEQNWYTIVDDIINEFCGV